MAKRFTDTAKWDKAWFRKLPSKMQNIWNFLCDKCDHAGIWEYDEDAFFYYTHEKITQDDLKKYFGDKIEFYEDDKLLIKAFLGFQYGELNQANRVHSSAMERIKKLKIKEAPSLGLTSPKLGCKDTDKEKDKDKEKGGCGGKNIFDLESAYKSYPLKLGKSDGMKSIKKQIKTQEDFDKFCQSVKNYKDYCEENKTERKYIKHFSTFANCWRDWVEKPEGTSLDDHFKEVREYAIRQEKRSENGI